jgi:hypothetical protein
MMALGRFFGTLIGYITQTRLPTRTPTIVDVLG